MTTETEMKANATPTPISQPPVQTPPPEPPVDAPAETPPPVMAESEDYENGFAAKVAAELFVEDSTEETVAEEPPAAPVPEPVQAQPPKEEDGELKSRLEVLAREQQKARQQIQAKEQELNARAEELSKWEKAKKDARLNPMAALEALGISYQVVHDFIMNDGKPTPEMRAAAAEAEVKSIRESQRLESERAQAIAYQRDIDAFKESIGMTIKESQDKYELLSAKGERAVEAAFYLVADFNNKNGQLPGDGTPKGSISWALDALEAREEAEMVRLLQTKKASAKVAPVEPRPSEPVAAKSPTKTISNALSGKPPPRTSQEPESIDPAELRRRAVEFLRQGQNS